MGDGANAYDQTVADALGFPAPDRLVGFVYVGTPPAVLRPVERPATSDHSSEWTQPVRAFGDAA